MKKMKSIILILLISFIFIDKEKAFYTAQAGTSWNNGGAGCSGYNCYSNINNEKLILQARLYYIDNASFTQVGETYYFANSAASNYLKDNGINNIYISSFDSSSDYEKAYDKLKNYFNNSENAKNYLKKVTGTQNYEEVLTKISDNNKGYRIMVEPAQIYGNPSFMNGNIALMTPKGLAAEQIKTGTKCSECNKKAQQLYMSTSELGIRVNNDKKQNPKDYCAYIDTAKIADIKIGCGYNLINISKYINVKCYNMSVNGTDVKCTNYDKNNDGTYEEVYTENSNCTSQADADRYKSYGKKYSENGTCKIYCKETGSISLPGNVLAPVKRGSYFAWPTKNSDKAGLYKLTMTTNLKCKIVDTGGSTTQTASAFTRQCQSKYTSYNDDCRATAVTSKVCPEGTKLWNDGKCYVMKNSSNRTPRTKEDQYANKVCESGYSEDSGRCRKITSYSYSYSCRAGYSGIWDASYTGSIPLDDRRCCKDGYKYNNKASGSMKIGCYKYVCPKGTTDINSGSKPCRKKITTYTCSSDGKLTTENDKKICVKGKSCSSGNLTSDGKCTLYKQKSKKEGWSCTGKSKNYTCKKSACSSPWHSYTSTECSKEATKTDGYDYVEKNNTEFDAVVPAKETKTANYSYKNKTACPTGYYDNGSNCKKTIDIAPTCDGNGTLDWVGGKKVCATCPSGYTYIGNGICRENNSKSEVCPWDDKKEYVLINGECHHRTSQTNYTYSCKNDEYTISSNERSCTKNCNITPLKNSVNEILKKEETGITLTGGTNQKITNETLDSEIIDKNYNENDLTYNKKTSFYIKSNRNRYYNKLTEQVLSEKVNSINIFDRQQGVISTWKKDIITENNLIKHYNLELKITNFGLNNQFGSKITNYVCHYTLTDTPDCICPEDTLNGGADVKYLVENVYKDKITREKTCAYWKEKICDKPIGRVYCKDTTKDITDCVKEQNKTVNLEDAIKICKIENGCVDNTCKGSCTEQQKKLDNIAYKVTKCDGKYCNYYAYCDVENRKTSESSEDCVKKALGVDDIIEALNNGTSIDKLEAAIRSCKNKICASDERIVFRIIDLKNPFPGKEHNNTLSGFSKEGKSRTPGYNWNSKLLVNNKIINNRGVSDYKLYSKEPLYKITLTPSNIKAIRNYNKNNKYDNQGLKCSNNNTSNCISYFLHDKVAGLDTDIKIEGVSSCKSLNASSTKEDFDACYNSNN